MSQTVISASTIMSFQAAKEFAAWILDYILAIKNGRLHPFTATERLSREATSSKAWGPTGGILQDISQISFDPEQCLVIMAVIEYRLRCEGEQWRSVYKAILLLEYLLKQGSEQCVLLGRNLVPLLNQLQAFEYVSTDNRDHGLNVRLRSKAVCSLIADEAALMKLRKQLAERARLRVLEEDGRQHPISNFTPVSQPGQLVLSTTYTPSRGAGESKGVTLEENKKNLAILKELLSRPENRVCADCRVRASCGLIRV
ncbi:hypothetical protein CEUSTIGMA_g11396.t1 [Chlamydomonas eustigma]|uniref:ENTH domain-containing protein n=1 Tax=Chlamydomonas eustigma TaxID=1157962 RepID=A0A250XM50_9CHLO|nr:hypothetical protein CEUSTIGMA_g11396.t1 [Chlamydomonas eustigma]|eukprot:GAX83972.1 hypothetical protein CEUSTIGMA_g11396.t1 [Chlamydomonas eustigma]